MQDRHRGAWFIAASAAGFATLGILIKSALAGGGNINTILAGRFLLAALILFFILKVRRVPMGVSSRTMLQLVLMGALGYGGMSMLYANAVQYLPVSLTGMLLYTYPALVTLLSVSIGDDRFSVPKGLALALCSTGLVLLLGASFEGANLQGVLSVLGAAVIYSCYIVVGNRILKSLDPLVTTLYVCASAGLAFLIYGLTAGELTLHITLSGWLSIAGIAVVPTLGAVLGFFAGLRLVGATNASIISTLEPLVTVFLSVVLLGERFTPLQVLGGALLLTGAVVLQLWDKKGSAEDEAHLGEEVSGDAA